MVLTFFFLFVLTDLYVYQALRNVFANSRPKVRKAILITHWGLAVMAVIALVLYHFAIPHLIPNSFRSYIIVSLFVLYISKLFGVLFLLIDDIRRGLTWVYRKVRHTAFKKEEIRTTHTISRSDFLSKLALVSVTIPFATMSYGIVSGAHNYRVRRRTIHLKNLPQAWDGVLIGQISDIHAGSFFDKQAVKKGVELLLDQKPDASEAVACG